MKPILLIITLVLASFSLQSQFDPYDQMKVDYEIHRVEKMSDLFVGVGDQSGDYPLTRRVKKDMEYVIGVDTQGNIKLINL